VLAEAEMFCPYCGNAVLPEHNFCRRCGGDLRLLVSLGGEAKQEAPPGGLDRPAGWTASLRLVPRVLREAVESGVQKAERELRTAHMGDKCANYWRWGLWAFWTGLLAAALGRVNGAILALIGIGLMVWARHIFERSSSGERSAASPVTRSPHAPLAREQAGTDLPTRPISEVEPPTVRIE